MLRQIGEGVGGGKPPSGGPASIAQTKIAAVVVLYRTLGRTRNEHTVVLGVRDHSTLWVS